MKKQTTYLLLAGSLLLASVASFQGCEDAYELPETTETTPCSLEEAYNLALPFLHAEGHRYVWHLTEEEARQLGISSTDYQTIVQDLQDLNLAIEEALAQGYTVNLIDPQTDIVCRKNLTRSEGGGGSSLEMSMFTLSPRGQKSIPCQSGALLTISIDQGTATVIDGSTRTTFFSGGTQKIRIQYSSFTVQSNSSRSMEVSYYLTRP